MKEEERSTSEFDAGTDEAGASFDGENDREGDTMGASHCRWKSLQEELESIAVAFRDE